MRTRHTFCISLNTQRNGTEVGEKCCAHQKSNAEVNKCSALAGTECETDEKWRIERDVDGSQECGKIVRNICLVFNVFRLCAAIYSSKYNPRKEITMAITWELLRTVVFPSVLFRAFNFFVVPFCFGVALASNSKLLYVLRRIPILFAFRHTQSPTTSAAARRI